MRNMILISILILAVSFTVAKPRVIEKRYNPPVINKQEIVLTSTLSNSNHTDAADIQLNGLKRTVASLTTGTGSVLSTAHSSSSMRYDRINLNRTGDYALKCQDENETYLPNMENYVYSPLISLPTGNQVIADFTLRGSFFDLDAFPDVDFFGWEVSPDAGTTWYYMSNPYGDPGGTNYVYTDAPDNWVSMIQSYSLDGRLDDYAGNTLQFRIIFHSDEDEPSGEGLFIDDFIVTVDGVTEYFESFEDSTMSGWVSEDQTAIDPMWHLDDWNAYTGSGLSWWMADTTIGTFGGYLDHWYQVIDTDPVDLTGVTDPNLTFYHRYYCEDPATAEPPYDGWDGMNVRISTDNGNSWQVLTDPTPVYTANSLYSFGSEFGEGPGVPGWAGTLTSWTQVTFDLSSYVGNSVKIRFAFASDPAYNTTDNPSMFGWQIDNIDVSDGTTSIFFNNGNGQGMLASNFVPTGGDLWHVGFVGVPPEPPPVPQNVVSEAGDGTIHLTWDNPGGDFNGLVSYDDGSFENAIGLIDPGEAYAGTLFDAPFGVTDINVNSISIYGYAGATGAANIYGFNMVFGTPEAIPTYIGTITLVDNQWVSQDITGWTFSGDFIIALGITDLISVPLDENSSPSSHSWFGLAWDTWANVAAGANPPLPDGEWGIRADVTSTGGLTPTYNVYRSTAGGNFILMFNGMSISVPEYTDNIVANGTEYCYQVTVIYDTTESEPSESVCATPEAQTIYEIIYDDDNPNTSTNVMNGNYLAVRFTPTAYPSTLKRIKYYVEGNQVGIAIAGAWDDDGDGAMPGTTLLSGLVVQLSPGWTVKDVSALGLTINDGDFFVGWQETTQTPPIGVDTDTPVDDRSYINVQGAPPAGTNGEWESLSTQFTGDIMIRVDMDSAGTVGIDDDLIPTIPDAISLFQNFPNPFNPLTQIAFELPELVRTKLSLYDLTGREVMNLVDRVLTPGHYQYQLDASDLAAGVYIYRLETSSGTTSKINSIARKLVVLK